MDNFDVLVKHYGINPKGKSAPMASSKKAPKTQNNYGSVHQDPNIFTPSSSKPNSGGGSLFDGQNDDVFGFNLSNKGQSYDVFDDVFQMPAKSSSGSGGGGGGFDFDMGSMFKGPGSGSGLGSGAKAVGVNGGDDIWGFGEKSIGSGGGSSNVGVGNGNGDLLSSDPVDEFWGKMAKLGSERGNKRLEEKKGSGDDLIPGFDMGFGNAFNDRAQTSAKENNIGVSSLDELENFATRGIGKDSNGHGGSFTSKSEPNFFDFGATVNGGSVQKEMLEKAEMMFQAEGPDLDMLFGAPINKRTPTSEKKDVNTKTYEEPNLFSGAGFGTDKRVSTSAFPDDFSSIFEGSPASGVFQEIEGESDERRSLRFARYQRAKARMRDAVDEMNQREFKAQQEQEEKYRIADAMEAEMKRWAAGKEGNLRALLSSLQLVIGPEFGWRSVSITDLITSSQVKIAYKKAALCIHPDKVQQRGANLEQKYVAEKAFDLLKEAWNKFSTEELR